MNNYIKENYIDSLLDEGLGAYLGTTWDEVTYLIRVSQEVIDALKDEELDGFDVDDLPMGEIVFLTDGINGWRYANRLKFVLQDLEAEVRYLKHLSE